VLTEVGVDRTRVRGSGQRLSPPAGQAFSPVG